MTEKNEKPVLFSITEDTLETGLRGYPIGYCTTSSVDPTKGLHYRGVSISSLYNKSPEELMYLLFYGKIPSEKELQDFSQELLTRAFLDKDFFSRLQGFPVDSQPMKVFSSALLLAGSLYGTNDWKEDALNIIAKVPLIAGGVIRYLKGKTHNLLWPVSQAARKSTWTERLVEALGPEIIPTSLYKGLEEALRLFMVLHMDHGGGNLSTFVGKAIASGLEDMYGSLAGAMLALEGPRHGRANQDCLDFLEKLIQDYGVSLTPAELETILRELIAKGELIYGYGHAVLRVEDARATVFYDLAQKQYAHHPIVQLALLLRDVAPKILSENPKISDPYPNVDAISGPVLVAAGFQYADCMPVLFGCSRIIGIARQIVYERIEARNGKGTPIVRPKYLYLEEGKGKSSQSG